MFAIGGRKDDKSQFHIMFNTNMSPKKFMDMSQELRIKLVENLTDVCEEFKKDILSYIKTESPKTKPKLTDCSFNLEVGKKKKHIHIDGYLAFDKKCMLKLKNCSDLFNKSIEDFDQRGLFTATFVPDIIDRVKKYSKKDGMSLI